jgi:hypothetical protein
VIAGPTEFDHAGAHGVHGRWSILASYRRLLAGLQLRNDGVTDVRRIRLLLWTSGRGGDARLAAEDLAHVFRKIAAHARQDVAVDDIVWSRAKTPLSLRRRVTSALDSFDATVAFPALTPTNQERVRAFLDSAPARQMALSLVDWTVRGPQPAITSSLRAAAALMPTSLPGPAEIIDVVSSSAGALAPELSNSGIMLEDLARVLPVDIMNAAGALRWLPRLLGWATTNLADDGPEGELIAQLSSAFLEALHALPADTRITGLAMLSVQYLRYREGRVSWAPGTIPTSSRELTA